MPFSIVGPLAGVLIDRFDRRRLLTIVPLVRAGLAILIPIAAVFADGWVFIAVVLCVLSLNRFFLATLGAVLPQLVPAGDLLVANSTSSTTGAVANVSGHAAGSLLAELIGGRSVAGVAAGAFAATGLLARDLPVHRGLDEPPAPFLAEVRRVVIEMRAGFAEMRAHPRVRYGMGVILFTQAMVGAMVGILIHYLVGELGLGPSSGFAMLSALAVGVGAGVVIVPAVARKVGNDRAIGFSFVVGAFGTLIPVISFNRPMLAASAVFIGVSYALAKIPVDTLVQEEIIDEVRGRAFAVYDMIFNLARVFGTAIVAILYEFGMGSRAQILMLAIAFAIAAAATIVRGRDGAPHRPGDAVRPDRDRPNASPEDPARSRVPTTPGFAFEAGDLVVVGSYAGARADEEPRTVAIGGRSFPIDEVLWRAVVEAEGGRSRVFVVACNGQRLRMRVGDDGDRWEVERTL